jgi:protein SCO1/2
MRRKAVLASIAALVLFWIGCFFVLRWARQPKESDFSAEMIASRIPHEPSTGQLPLLWEAPAFSYPDQDSRIVTEKTLRDHVWISDFIFTGCASICPMMTAKMSRLQQTIANPNIHFVSFSVDPDHDTPQVLKAYAKMWKADESRWHFLSTSWERLAATAAGMKTFVRPPDKDEPIQHSSLFILTDASGQVRGVYDSNDSAALQRLIGDALTLAGTPPSQIPKMESAWSMPESVTPAGRPGARLYISRGCAACHAQERVAPALANRFGETVLLADGHTLIADEAYLRESILEPNAKITSGYPRLMPSYRGQLTDEEVNQLVEYIKSIPGSHAAGHAAVATQAIKPADAIDPVCKMTVTINGTVLRAEHRGKTYYFCSAVCRQQFLKDPGRFIGDSSKSK